jgi:hypothetical protein
MFPTNWLELHPIEHCWLKLESLDWVVGHWFVGAHQVLLSLGFLFVILWTTSLRLIVFWCETYCLIYIIQVVHKMYKWWGWQINIMFKGPFITSHIIEPSYWENGMPLSWQLKDQCSLILKTSCCWKFHWSQHT